jgi:hypothetical protein
MMQTPIRLVPPSVTVGAAPAPLTLDDRLLIPGSVVSRDLDGDMVIVNLETGIYIGLDEVAADIWKQIEARARLRDVRDRVAADYDVTPDTAAEDLLCLAHDLVARGLAVVDSNPPN